MRDLPLEAQRVLHGLRATTTLVTLLDLCTSASPNDVELAAESALHLGLVSDVELWASAARPVPGALILRRFMERRGRDTPPTESMLETLSVQIARDGGLPDAARQVEVRSPGGGIAWRVDMAWPWLGMFAELDGEQHADQPVYDANRQNAIIAVTGWLPVRWSWTAVTTTPFACVRQWHQVQEQAAQRR